MLLTQSGIANLVALRNASIICCTLIAATLNKRIDDKNDSVINPLSLSVYIDSLFGDSNSLSPHEIITPIEAYEKW